MQLSDLRGNQQYADRAFRGLAIAAAGLVLLVLGMIAVVMTRRAWPALFGANGESDGISIYFGGSVVAVIGVAMFRTRMARPIARITLAAAILNLVVALVVMIAALPFFTSIRWSPADGLFGALPFIWGTLFTAVIALAIAVPISLGVALFITQVAPPWLKKPMVYLVDLLAVVPSVVFGLWGVLVLSQHFGLGRSFLTAGIILAIMITPIITSLAREVIETTPASEKEAALALGATRWEMITASVLPHSNGGLVGAVMLGLGRAMGETIAAALVIGAALGQITANPLAPGYSMPAVIANEWGEADDAHKAALIALAVTLFVITIAVNLIATAIVQRSMKRSRGT